jgi:hypothetical protein
MSVQAQAQAHGAGSDDGYSEWIDQQFAGSAAMNLRDLADSLTKRGVRWLGRDCMGHRWLAWCSTRVRHSGMIVCCVCSFTVAELSSWLQVNKPVDEEGNTLLLLAAHKGDVDVVSACLRHGANVNGQNKAGNTALHVALEKGHVAIADLLVKAGALAEIRNSLGMYCGERTDVA